VKKKITILTYHRVLSRHDPYREGDVLLRVFDAQMRMLSRFYRVMTLADAVTAQAEGRLPYRAMVVTFDDGYADNHDVDLPILQNYGIPATFFVATGFLNGGRMWNDTIIDAVAQTNETKLDLTDTDMGNYDCNGTANRIYTIEKLIGKLKYLPTEERLMRCARVLQATRTTLSNDLMMRSDQIRAMADAGMEIGGHTVNHPILSQVGDEIAVKEIANGKAELEGMTQKEVTSFAYPNGRPEQDFQDKHASMVEQAGFKAAVTTERGMAYADNHRFRLPRFTSWDQSAVKFLLRMIHGRWIAY
jgi:peptidoglycan/xylan/chitin deacetylase (PgdA/CDA1 family)